MKQITGVVDYNTSLLEQASDGIVFIDPKGAIVGWNPGTEKIFGLKRDEVLGRFLWDVQFRVTPEGQRNPANYERLRAMLLSFLETRQAPWLNRLQETVIQRPDGTRRIVQVSVFPIRAESGDIAKGIAAGSIIRDITERRQMEETLREAHRLALEQYERIAGVRSRLISGLSHELRTPLFVLSSYLRLLADANSNDGSEIRAMSQAVTRLQQLAHDILSLSQGAEGLALNRQDLPLSALVEGVIQVVGLDPTRIRVDLPTDVRFSFDPYWLVQALAGVLNNATQYSGGPIALSGSLDRDGQWLTLLITDEGPGILPEHHQSIFEPFVRLDASQPGRGMGLAMARLIVEAHGGAIWIESDPASQPGTTVGIRLPVHAPPWVPPDWREDSRPVVLVVGNAEDITWACSEVERLSGGKLVGYPVADGGEVPGLVARLGSRVRGILNVSRQEIDLPMNIGLPIFINLASDVGEDLIGRLIACTFDAEPFDKGGKKNGNNFTHR